MIPILFPSNETAFATNGIGRLRCTEAYVEETRNGEYEMTFTVPITDRHFGNIQEGMYVLATHDNTGDTQPFKIYGRTAPMNGLVTFRAHHKSYELSNVIVNPFSATSAPEAIARIRNFCINACPYEFWTDKTTVANFALTEPASVRSILGGMQGSFLDAFGGGEYEFDGNTVKFWNSRGADNGVTIRYGKNLVDIEQEIDALGIYNAIVPFWAGEVNEQHVLVLLDERMVAAQGVTNPVPVVMDMSSEFDEQPTQAQLRQKAANYLADNEPWVPSQNIKVDFVQLWQTEEYKQYAPLQRVGLCDTVTVYYKALGITGKAKVIRTKYNVLLERYDEIELGNPRTSFADTIKKDFDAQMKQTIVSMQGFMDAAIASATDLITGGSGGNVVIGFNAAGKPSEILIMDTADMTTATNIIRINMNGIGFSTNGGQTYRNAWTIDGHFVADFIDTGTLNANIMRAGIITDAQGLNFWNLETGDFRMAATTQVGTGGTTVGDLATGDEVTAAVNTGINNYRQEVNALIDDLQDQIDGVIDTYYYAYVPTLNNYPASDWTTEALRNEHEGDLFMDTTTGKSYRFLKQNNVWQWVEIPDTAAAQALQAAQDAQNLANTKRRIFTSTPYTPYDVGDLWVQGATGDIFKCSTARASGNYTANDWDKASKYTDDTVANQALEAIQTMEIGGRNLLHNTNVISLSPTTSRPNINGDSASSGYLSASSGSLTAATHGARITSNSAVRPGIIFGSNTPSASGTHGLAVGREYTFSCDWETKTLGGSPDSTTTYYLRACLYYATSTSASSMTQQSFATWHTFGTSDTSDRNAVVSGHGSFTFTVPDDAVAWNIRVYSTNISTASLYAAGNYLQIENVKLETGQKGTAWTPAPEDINSDINGINVYLATLQGQVDEKAETWYQANDPAVTEAWTAAEKEAHEGDLWYRTTDGVTLRYSGSAWQEQDVPTEVFDAIDGKAQIFVSQPTPPYAVGDLWVQGLNGDILRCQNARADGESYTVSDWVKASKYTDDSAFTAFRDGTYASFVTQTNQTLDAKVTTFYQANQPTATATGDLWIDTDDGNKLYRWSGSAWVAVQDTAIQSALTAASNAQTTADGKIVTFAQASQPTATDTGDLWIDTDDNNKLYRWSGSAWVAVTDTSAVTALNSALNQQEIFNRLTNNGQTQGVYMQNGLLYINAQYMVAGRIADATGNSYWDLETGELVINGDVIMSATSSDNRKTVETANGDIQFYPLQNGHYSVDVAHGLGFGTTARLARAGKDVANFSVVSNVIGETASGTNYVTDLYVTKYARGYSDTYGAQIIDISVLNNGSDVDSSDVSHCAYEESYLGSLYSSTLGRYVRCTISLYDNRGTADKATVIFDQYLASVKVQDASGSVQASGFKASGTQSNGSTWDVNINGSSQKIQDKQIAFQSTSSRRYKEAIRPVQDPVLDPHRLYDLEVKQFKYHEGMIVQYDDMADKTHVGFIAEDVAEIYPDAVIHDTETGQIESWDERRILPPMLKLIQEQKEKIDELETRIARLEALLLKEE